MASALATPGVYVPPTPSCPLAHPSQHWAAATQRSHTVPPSQGCAEGSPQAAGTLGEG